MCVRVCAWLFLGVVVFARREVGCLQIFNFAPLTQKLNGSSLQVPVIETPNKWGLMVIDSKNYLSHMVQVKETSEYSIKAVEICANLKIKNMFTSNNLYSPASLPKEMQLMLLKNETFSQKYSYIHLGDKTYQEEAMRQEIKENIQPTQPKKNLDKEYGKTYLKTILQGNVEEDQPRIEPRPFTLQEKQKQEIVVQRQPEFRLEPAPLMQIQHIQGFTGGVNNICLFTNSQIIYSSGNVMIMMDLTERTQKFFFGQHTVISNIVCNSAKNIIVSTDLTQISFWDAASL